VENLLAIYAPMKNEVNNIEGWYESAKQVADEMVIIDTGSIDGTIEKIKNTDIKLYHSKLFNKDTLPENWHFANARNEVLSHCTAKWIIAMDADERIIVLDPLFKEKLKDVDNNIDLIYCPVEIIINNGKVTQQFLGERLFRNRPDIKYKGAMHNYVTASQNKRKRYSWVKIQSSRKNTTLRTHQQRIKQRLSMAEKNFISQIEENPNDTRSMFYLARTYRSYNKLDDAIKWYEKYLSISKWNIERYQAALEMAICFQQKKQFDISSQIMGMHLKENWKRAEGYILLGKNAYITHDFEQAVWWFTIATKCKWFDGVFFLQKNSYTYEPWDRLSMALSHLKRYKEAAEAARKALKYEGDSNFARIRKNIEFFEKHMKNS